MLLHIGEWATVTDIMKEMDATYGNVATTERLKEQFYSARQKEGETIVDYSLRLENLLCNSQLNLDRKSRDDMLRNRLWSGLRDQVLKNVMRYKFETELDYTSFRRELRLVEEDLKASQSSKVESEKFKVSKENVKTDVSKVTDVRQCNVSFDSKILKELQELSTQMKTLNTRVSNIEKGLEEVKKSRRNEGDSYRWRNRGMNYRNQEKETEKPVSTEPDLSSKQKTLNQQNPPTKGQ